MVCEPTLSVFEQLAVPVVSAPLMRETASGPQSVVAPSLKVTFALRMSPGAVSPDSGMTALSRTVALRSDVRPSSRPTR